MEICRCCDMHKMPFLFGKSVGVNLLCLRDLSSQMGQSEGRDHSVFASEDKPFWAISIFVGCEKSER